MESLQSNSTLTKTEVSKPLLYAKKLDLLEPQKHKDGVAMKTTVSKFITQC